MVSLKILKFQGKAIDGLLGRVYHFIVNIRRNRKEG